MECHFYFNKETISKNVEKFLCENLPNEMEHIKRIMSEKTAIHGGNQVLRNLLTALTATNTHVTEEIVIGPQDDEDAHTGEEHKSDGGMQSDTKAHTLDTKTHPLIKENNDTKTEDPKNKIDICHFYTINKCKFGNTINKCKFGKECRKMHPKMCAKFKKFGLKKFNKSGYEDKELLPMSTSLIGI